MSSRIPASEKDDVTAQLHEPPTAEPVVDEVDEVDEVDDAAPPPAGPGRGGRAAAWLRGHLAALVAALVLVALVVALVLTTLALRHEHALDSARSSALKAGKESAVALSSYDYRSLDRDFGAVTARSTPRFRDSFNQTSGSLKKVLQQYDATATSTVVAAGVTSASQQRAVVLVFLNQVATNTNQTSGPTTDQSRIEVTLARSGSAWLIDGVKLL